MLAHFTSQESNGSQKIKSYIPSEIKWFSLIVACSKQNMSWNDLFYPSMCSRLHIKVLHRNHVIMDSLRQSKIHISNLLPTDDMKMWLLKKSLEK